MLLERTKKPWMPKRQKVNKSWAHDQRYHTTRWRKLRASFLKSNPLCVQCKEAGKTIPAQVVDHIRPLSQDSSDNNFWNPLNHQALCKRCNNRKAKTDAIRKRR